MSISCEHSGMPKAKCFLGHVDDAAAGGGCHPRDPSSRDIRTSGGCKAYVLHGTWVLPPVPPKPQRLGF